MDKNRAQKLIQLNKQTYNHIASEFSNSRKYLWPEIKTFSHYIKDNQKILDLGCGNGRLLNLLNDYNIEYIGVDNSKELIKEAGKKHPEGNFKIAQLTSLPFTANKFNLIFSIAVIHHLPSQEKRREAVREIKRVLKKEGLLIVSVWNLNRPKYLKQIQKSQRNHPYLESGDWLKPWGSEKKHFRYYHAFKKKEFINLFTKQNLRVIDSKFSKHNCWLVAKK